MLLQFPGFETRQIIGTGAMGKVFLVSNPQFGNRLEAIKIIHNDILEGTPENDKILKYFETEKTLHGRLEHSGIVKVYTCGTVEDPATAQQLPYLVMEYLPGGNLKERLDKGPLEEAEAVRIIRAVAEALDYAHQKNVVHRDIKPSNILFDGEDRPKLADFGVSRELSVELTRTISTVGTVSYMSPEQGAGKIEPRADLYSLGCILFEMFTGRKVFEGRELVVVLHKHSQEPPPPLPDRYRKFQPLMDKLLAKDPNDRFPNARALIEALDRAHAADGVETVLDPQATLPVTPPPQHQPPRPSPTTPPHESGWWKPPPALAVLLILLVAGIGLGIYWFIGQQTPPEPPPVQVYEIRVRRLIHEGQCQEAADALAEGLQWYPEHIDLRALGIRVESCKPVAT